MNPEEPHPLSTISAPRRCSKFQPPAGRGRGCRPETPGEEVDQKGAQPEPLLRESGGVGSSTSPLCPTRTSFNPLLSGEGNQRGVHKDAARNPQVAVGSVRMDRPGSRRSRLSPPQRDARAAPRRRARPHRRRRTPGSRRARVEDNLAPLPSPCPDAAQLLCVALTTRPNLFPALTRTLAATEMGSAGARARV